MSSNSIFSSIESEKRWVLAMKKSFSDQHIVDIDFDTTCCVFKVPNTLSEAKPEAYSPHHLGLGPYHHLRPELYTMHKQKLSAIRKCLSPENLHNFQLLVDGLVQWEPLIRTCYDQYLDLDIETLAWILAVDGLYLLHFLKKCPEMENLAADVIMLENQIPVVLLKKIQQILELAPCDDGEDAYSFFEEFQAFCRDQSPLELNKSRAVIGNISQVHLLHCMYCLIVNNRGIQDEFFHMSSGPKTRILNDFADSMPFLAERGVPGAATAGQILSFVNKIPWNRILGLFKKEGADEQTVLAEEIDIPAVSQMSEIAGIKFILTNGGIRDIRFQECDKEGNKFHLPVIRLTPTSEVVLRNLVAYEAASAEPGSALELAEYVDLMCGIIDSAKDVDILKKEKIIDSELPDEEIARIFNGISKSTKKKDNKSNVEEAIDNVNTTYSNLVSVKVKRFLEKHVSAFLKLMSVLISIAVLVLLVLQAFCSVFGCSRWFGQITTQSDNLLLSY